MAKYISVDDFIKETNGKAYDIDGVYGVQCVDAVKKFNLDVYNACDFTCGNGWAYGLWTCYGTNGVEKYFDKYEYNDAKKGDWIVWNKGSKSCPDSHVSMFIERVGNGKVKAYGQNQNGKKYFNTTDISEDGILGVLRPKIYVSEDDFLPEKGYFKKGDNENNVSKINDFLIEQIKGSDYNLYTEYCAKAFQRENGLDEDGYIGQETLDKMVKKGFKY